MLQNDLARRRKKEGGGILEAVGRPKEHTQKEALEGGQAGARGTLFFAQTEGTVASVTGMGRRDHFLKFK